MYFRHIKPEYDYEAVRKAFLSVFPFRLEEEKVKLEEQTAVGFNERKIKILTVVLRKQSHTNTFVKNLLDKLEENGRKLLLKQIDSRLDKELNFFIRLDLTDLARGAYEITESGECLHIKIAVAAFPHKRENAIAIIEKILK